MSLVSQILADRTRVFLRTCDFAESVEYTQYEDSTSTTRPVVGIWDSEQGRYEYGDGHTRKQAEAKFTFSLADVSDPKLTDTVQKDGRVYGVDKIGTSAGGMVTVYLVLVKEQYGRATGVRDRV